MSIEMGFLCKLFVKLRSLFSSMNTNVFIELTFSGKLLLHSLHTNGRSLVWIRMMFDDNTFLSESFVTYITNVRSFDMDHV